MMSSSNQKIPEKQPRCKEAVEKEVSKMALLGRRLASSIMRRKILYRLGYIPAKVFVFYDIFNYRRLFRNSETIVTDDGLLIQLEDNLGLITEQHLKRKWIRLANHQCWGVFICEEDYDPAYGGYHNPYRQSLLPFEVYRSWINTYTLRRQKSSATIASDLRRDLDSTLHRFNMGTTLLNFWTSVETDNAMHEMYTLNRGVLTRGSQREAVVRSFDKYIPQFSWQLLLISILCCTTTLYLLLSVGAYKDDCKNNKDRMRCAYYPLPFLFIFGTSSLVTLYVVILFLNSVRDIIWDKYHDYKISTYVNGYGNQNVETLDEASRNEESWQCVFCDSWNNDDQCDRCGVTFKCGREYMRLPKNQKPAYRRLPGSSCDSDSESEESSDSANGNIWRNQRIARQMRGKKPPIKNNSLNPQSLSVNNNSIPSLNPNVIPSNLMSLAVQNLQLDSQSSDSNEIKEDVEEKKSEIDQKEEKKVEIEMGTTAFEYFSDVPTCTCMKYNCDKHKNYRIRTVIGLNGNFRVKQFKLNPTVDAYDVAMSDINNIIQEHRSSKDKVKYMRVNGFLFSPENSRYWLSRQGKIYLIMRDNGKGGGGDEKEEEKWEFIPKKPPIPKIIHNQILQLCEITWEDYDFCRDLMERHENNYEMALRNFYLDTTIHLGVGFPEKPPTIKLRFHTKNLGPIHIDPPLHCKPINIMPRFLTHKVYCPALNIGQYSRKEGTGLVIKKFPDVLKMRDSIRKLRRSPVIQVFPMIQTQIVYHVQSTPNVVQSLLQRQMLDNHVYYNPIEGLKYRTFLQTIFLDYLPTAKPEVSWDDYISTRDHFSASKKKRYMEARLKVENDLMSIFQGPYAPKYGFVKQEPMLKYIFACARMINSKKDECQTVLAPIFRVLSLLLKNSWSQGCFYNFVVKHRVEQDLFIYTDGLDSNQKGELFSQTMKRKSNKTFLTIDFSKFDASQSPEIIKNEMIFYKKMMPDPEIRRILQAHVTASAGRWVTYCNDRKTGGCVRGKVTGTRSSGDPQTTLGNTLLNASLILYALVEYFGQQIREHATIFVSGDDSLVVLHDIGFIENEKKFRTPLNNLGFKISLSQTDIPSKAEFCSRFFVRVIDCQADAPTWYPMCKIGNIFSKSAVTCETFDFDKIMSDPKEYANYCALVALKSQGLLNEMHMFPELVDFFGTINISARKHAAKCHKYNPRQFRKYFYPTRTVRAIDATYEDIAMRYNTNMWTVKSSFDELNNFLDWSRPFLCNRYNDPEKHSKDHVHNFWWKVNKVDLPLYTATQWGKWDLFNKQRELMILNNVNVVNTYFHIFNKEIRKIKNSSDDEDFFCCHLQDIIID
jgi:hypothetical protein